jgi:hypothetical protein
MDPFEGLTTRQTAALRLSVQYRKAALLARKKAEVASAEALMSARVARREGVGMKRLAHAWGVAPSYIHTITKGEAGGEKVVLPLTAEYSQNEGTSSADDPALEGVGAIEGEEHLDQLPPGEVDVPRGVFLPPDSDP